MRSPRRLILTLLSIPILFLLLLLYLNSHTSISDLFSTTAHPSRLPDEIFGLLHFVTSPEEAGRAVIASHVALENGTQLGGPVAPEKPVDMAWYALGSTTQAGERTRRKGPENPARGWEERLKVLREESPLVVFSKSYCPYSKRAKRLLEAYDLSPAPKIIEVDLRPDPSHIKTLLMRLTRRSTFPNVILHGRSLGGSDDLVQLHDEDRLRQVLEEGGMNVRGNGILL